MKGISVEQTLALSSLTQQKAGVIGMATRFRRSIGYNQAYDVNNQYGSEGLCTDLKAHVDAWEARELGRIAQEIHAINEQTDGN